MAEFLTKRTNQKISQSTICRILQKDGLTYKKITYHYSEQIPRLRDIKESTDFLKSLPSSNILALDECAFRLNEAPRYGYYWKGMRANHGRPGKRGSRYTLLLCIQNVNGKGVIHWELIEKGANAQDLHDFIKGINLNCSPFGREWSNGEKYYLLLDNARIHHAVKSCRKLKLPTVREQLLAKNMTPVFLVPYTPQLNPVELCFNIIRKFVEKHRPRTYEELKEVITKIISILQEKDLTTFFKHCMDYDLIEKNYREKGSTSRSKSGHELWIE